MTALRSKRLFELWGEVLRAILKPVKERVMSTADGQDPKKLAPHELRDKITDGGQHPEKLAPYEHRYEIMMMAEELAQSIVPEESLSDDAIRRLDLLYVEVSNALGISSEDVDPMDDV
jgi:hypothetical protein